MRKLALIVEKPASLRTRPIRMLLVALFACVSACQKMHDQVVVSTPELDISFELTDENGKVVTADMYGDRLRLVFFGFASCPDICPITLQNIGMAIESLGPLAPQVTVLFISVDPKRDTPDVLRTYTDAFHPAIIGLTGSYEQLLRASSGFHTTFGYTLASESAEERPLGQEEYESLSESDGYLPYHSSQLYLIGTDDELLDLIAYGSKPALIEKKLRAHLN